MAQSSSVQIKQKLCQHCKVDNRKPIESGNFSRHIKDHHNNIYQERKKEGGKRARGYQYQVDFLYGPSIKRTKQQDSTIQSIFKEREEIVENEMFQNSQLSQSFDIQEKSIAKSDFQMNARKREKKAEQKQMDQQFLKLKRQLPKQSISISTDLNSIINTRIQLIEQEQQQINHRIETLIQTQKEQSNLLQSILTIIGLDSNNKINPQNIEKDKSKEQNQFICIDNALSNTINYTQCIKIQDLTTNLQVCEEIKQQNNLEILKNIDNKAIDIWKTWVEVKPNKEQPQLSDEPQNPGYTNEVSKQLIGTEITQGFRIKTVLGAGSVGTTVLCYDQQEDKDVALKIYHVTHAISSGLREFQMMHLASLAPSIVKVNCLMYNSSGSFLAISMEDLSQYCTVYNFVSQELCDTNQRLLIVRNIARALAELHKIKIVHGDFATENILINTFNQDVKIIDFDISAKEGEKITAAGNPDFVTQEIDMALNLNKTIKATYHNDIYALGLICYLILGDKEKIFYHSLSAEQLSTSQKEKMIKKEKFIGNNIVTKMISRNITASEAAIEFQIIYEKMNNQQKEN